MAVPIMGSRHIRIVLPRPEATNCEVVAGAFHLVSGQDFGNVIRTVTLDSQTKDTPHHSGKQYDFCINKLGCGRVLDYISVPYAPYGAGDNVPEAAQSADIIK